MDKKDVKIEWKKPSKKLKQGWRTRIDEDRKRDDRDELLARLHQNHGFEKERFQ